MAKIGQKTKSALLPLALILVILIGALAIDLRLATKISQLRITVPHLGPELTAPLTAAVLHEARLALWLAVVLCLGGGGVTFWFLHRRFTAPLLALARQATALAGEQLNPGQRLEVKGSEETQLLETVVNQLLDKMEQQQADKLRDLQFLQTLINTIPHPIYYKDPACRYLGCNRAFEQVIGIRQEELVGKTVFDVVPPENARIYEQTEHDLLAHGGLQTYEAGLTYADGSAHQLLFFKAALTDKNGSINGIVGTYLDITGRLEAEKALHQQKEFSENLLRNATVAAFVVNPQHRTIIWNRACEALTGISAEQVLGTDRHWSAFYPEQHPCLADLVIDQELAGAGTRYEEYRKSPVCDEGVQAEGWYDLAGQRRYILFSAAPVRDMSGSIVAAIETIEDITDRKEREEELAAVAQAVSIGSGEAFFSAVTHFIAKTLGMDYALIGSLDPKNMKRVQTLAVAAHGGFAPNFSFKLSGTPCENVMQNGLRCYARDVTSLFPEDHLLSEMGIEGYIGVPLLGSGKVPLGILVALHGEPIAAPERAGALLKIFASRTAAELQRLQDESWLRKLSFAVSQSPVSILITDPQGRIEFVNPKFSRVTGYSADEVEGKTPAILKSGETPPAVYREMWSAISKGMVWEGVFHNRRKDGELYWEKAYIGPIKDEHGTIINYIGIKEDITERKRLERALQHAQKMEAVGQLAGGVAHDFNNVLTAVIGYASIAEIHAGEDELLKSAVQQITKAAERGAHLTKSLLTFSRKQATNPQPIDLNEVVTRGEKLLSRLIDETIDLKVSLTSEPLLVLVDCLEIEQVLMNLITNARDAMPHGGVISLVTGKARIDRQFVRDYGFGIPGEYAVLCIADNGVGMDEKTTEKIFEPFFTTKENGQGTGLGMAIVYNIVKSHKGNVVCTSREGEGTNFTIYLPLQRSTTVIAGKETAVRLRGNELILVVEDEPEIRTLMRRFLEEFGYRVMEAGDGEEAIVLFDEMAGEISLVVLDAGLPRLSGPDALAAMRIRCPDLKGIIVSGYAQNDCLTVLDEEKTSFLAKPIGPTDLVRAVREELDK